MVSLFPLIVIILGFISTRFVTQLRASACRNSGILDAYITGFIKALQQLRAIAITTHLIGTGTLSFRAPSTIFKGTQQNELRIEENIKVVVKRTFFSSLFFCCEVTFPWRNFLQMAMLLPQIILPAMTPYDERA